MLDFENGQPEKASAVIEWASRGDRTYVRATVSLRMLSDEEITAVVGRIADRVPGMSLCAVSTSIFGTTFQIRPTSGNSTVNGMQWILDHFVSALNLELHRDVRENDRVAQSELLAAAIADAIAMAKIFYPFSSRRSGSSFNRGPWGDEF